MAWISSLQNIARILKIYVSQCLEGEDSVIAENKRHKIMPAHCSQINTVEYLKSSNQHGRILEIVESTRSNLFAERRTICDGTSEKGASSWLSKQPLQKHKFTTTKSEIKDVFGPLLVMGSEKIPMFCSCCKLFLDIRWFARCYDVELKRKVLQASPLLEKPLKMKPA